MGTEFRLGTTKVLREINNADDYKNMNVFNTNELTVHLAMVKMVNFVIYTLLL